ncbi:MAG: CDP-alcohol phosphatidyltransferase family protein [Ignavibacteria bacterium]|nr:CDP-alcohol phosphatidyltransferase family protein [Ignavibacteria bacterium]
MDKLPEREKFFDFSDYSRPLSRFLVRLIKDTNISPLTFTTISLICGLVASVLVYYDYSNFLTALLIIGKSFFDAVDGELARAKNRPSYVGRFYDSVADFVVNVSLFTALFLRFNESLFNLFMVIILFHLQGSIYNYYYVLKRHKAGGDTTSKINEREIKSLYPYDNPLLFKIFHRLYLIIYYWQDALIYRVDKSAEELKNIPNSFMTLVSLLGLGTQLMIIAVFILFDLEKYLINFFIYPYTFFAILVILLRKLLWSNKKLVN